MKPDRLQVFYNKRTRALDAGDYLRQVGHTVGSQPISPDQFARMVEQIRELLNLRKHDVLMDLCCGNGVITRSLAESCGRVVGIDFSSALVEVARQDQSAENIHYVLGDARQLEVTERGFTKVLMYGALQHFKPAEFRKILESITSISKPDVAMLFGFVPDKKHKWTFYNTFKRRLDLCLRLFSGREYMGTWWDRKQIQTICDEFGLRCSFHRLPRDFDAARYRFHVRVHT